MPAEISSPLHFNTMLKGHSYVIVDWYADWCGPCKFVSPFYNTLSATHSSDKFAFVKVNVDEQRELAARYGISAMPTFLLFKDGQKIEEVRGADPRRIKAAVEKASNAIKTEAVKAAEAAQPTPIMQEKQSNETKTEEQTIINEKTVSGSYGMTGGNNWKMSLY